MQISGTGHWFLEGWIGDHSVEFLVDSGSSVTAMSDTFYRTLVHAGAPLGTLQYTARTLLSANGTGIEVLGCSYCTVSFLGLRTEFPIIVCNLATGTDTIIGCFGVSAATHPRHKKMGCCLRRVALRFNFTGRIWLCPAVFLQWATPRYHLTQKLYCTALFELLAVGHFHLVAYWRV